MYEHNIPPVYDNDSRILILGSFPSVKSRQSGFFYGHPQNRFWKVLAKVFDSPVPETIAEKKAFLLSYHIAVWDVLGSCEISGSADSSIKNAKPNPIEIIINECDIQHIYVNGKTAEKYYNRYISKKVGIKAVCLPSTSPANAEWSLTRLSDSWRIIRNDI